MFAEVAEEQSNPDERAEIPTEIGRSICARERSPPAPSSSFAPRPKRHPTTGEFTATWQRWSSLHRHDLNGAEKAVEEGIADGADPQILSATLADVALGPVTAAGRKPRSSRGSNTAPDSYQTLIELAQIYADDGKVDRAVLTFQKAIEIKPDSPEAYFQLAEVEESGYQYYAAEQAYRTGRGAGARQRSISAGFDGFPAQVEGGCGSRVSERGNSMKQFVPAVRVAIFHGLHLTAFPR